MGALVWLLSKWRDIRLNKSLGLMLFILFVSSKWKSLAQNRTVYIVRFSCMDFIF